MNQKIASPTAKIKMSELNLTVCTELNGSELYQTFYKLAEGEFQFEWSKYNITKIGMNH